MLNVSEAKPSKPARPPSEPASDVLHHREHPLGFFFAPNAVAVIGASASPNSVGRTLLYNLVSHPFGGTVFPVNSKRSEVLGIKAYPSIAEVPEKVDLAVIATPAATVPGVVDECVQAGVRGAIIISAGFKEAGPAGAELERQVFEKASRGKMRIIGPNCLGLMNPITGLNATFASAIAKPGTVGFISQSGALCTAILDWSFREHVGFSAFISIGSMADVGWGDLVDYLGDDPNTRSIIIYMESVGDARSFLSAAREVAFTKPIIMLKAGRTAAATKAAASHTGALTGNDDVLDAAFRRSGVLRVEHMAELFHMAEVLAKQPRPRGPRLAIVTNAGGPGVLAADALLTHGGELAPLAPETMSALNAILPPHWSHNNPVDILGDSDADRYAKAVEVLAKDSTSDGLLVILTPQAMTDPTQTAEQLKPHAKLDRKPILASWMGGANVAAGDTIQLRPGAFTTDVADSEAALRAAREAGAHERAQRPQRALRNAQPGGVAAGPAARPKNHSRSSEGGAETLDRGRVEAGACRLRHSDSGDTARPHGRRSRSRRRRNRLPCGRETSLPNDHAQDRGRRRLPEPRGCGRRRTGV